MTQYIAKSTLITADGVRYQLGHEYSEKDLKGLSNEEISEHFKVVVSKSEAKRVSTVVKAQTTPETETQPDGEINEADGEGADTTTTDTTNAPDAKTPETDAKPVKPANGGKGKNKGKGKK